jgi:hypothetical protein
MKSLYRSALRKAGKAAEILGKIKTKRIVFEVGATRFDARNCTGVAIDENAPGGLTPNISFTRPGGSGPENYDLSDITAFKRLRTKKWLIKIKGDANPA